MVSIKKFLEKVVIYDSIKEYLMETWNDLELYVKRLQNYSIDTQKIFLKDYLIKEIVASNRIEKTLYTFEIMDLYKNGFFNSCELTDDFIKLLNKIVRKKDKIISKDNYISEFINISYEEYLKNELWNLSGNYRKNIVWLGESNNISEAAHVPPKPNEIDEYMNDFLEYYNNPNYISNESINDPIIKSALMHLIFIKIHPFGNGNGRTARILLNENLRKEINKRCNSNFAYPPVNLSNSFKLSQLSYNEKQNEIIFDDEIDNNDAINAWIKYNLIAINEQLYFLNNRLDFYADFLDSIEDNKSNHKSLKN